MHNTVGDVALVNISRETKYYRDFIRYPKYTFFSFPQPWYGNHLKCTRLSHDRVLVNLTNY